MSSIVNYFLLGATYNDRFLSVKFCIAREKSETLVYEWCLTGDPNILGTFPLIPQWKIQSIYNLYNPNLNPYG